MILQNLLIKRKKISAWLDILETLTGLGLAIFLHMHMIFISSIHFGRNFFDGLTHFLDVTYLSYIGIPPLIIMFFLHFLLAARKIPVQFNDQVMVFRHARFIKHPDTILWIWQVITGMGILILASIHLWVIIAEWPISADASIARVQNTAFLYFYIVLVLLGVAHTYMGLYRIMVKWVGDFRAKTAIVLVFASVFTVTLSFFSLYTFTYMR